MVLRKKKGVAVALTPSSYWWASTARGCLLRNDVDVGVLGGALDAKLNDALGSREQRMVRPDPHIHARAIHRAALANQDIAGEHIFTAEFLHAQTLGVRVAAVAGTAACFFVCHESLLTLSDDLRDFHIGIGLPMGLL